MSIIKKVAVRVKREMEEEEKSKCPIVNAA
jgi:hypothetical protein